jgi:hypothetical protein
MVEARFRIHCEQHIRGTSRPALLTILNARLAGRPKMCWPGPSFAARFFSDDTVQGASTRDQVAWPWSHSAPTSIPGSLKQPQTALGLVIAGKDINQVPRFHAEAILAACEPRCEVVMRLPEGGHGAMLSRCLSAGNMAACRHALE